MSDRSAEGLEGAVDLHVDTLSRLVEVGGGFIERPDLQVGPERCRRGGVRLLCAACYTRDDDPSPGVSVEAMLELCEGIDADPRSRARRVTTTGELEALGPDEIGLLLTIENGRSLEGRIEPIEAWRRRGVRILGVTWNGANELGEGVMEDRGGGLTRFGRDAIALARRLGIAIDLSHLNPAGVQDVLDMDVPVLATHSNARTIWDHPRNLTDEQLRTIAAAGGIAGLNFCPAFLGAAGEVDLGTVARHASHMAGVMGADRVALGTDLDGIDEPPPGFEGHQDLPAVAHALEDAGFRPREVAGILGGNFLAWWRRWDPLPE